MSVQSEMSLCVDEKTVITNVIELLRQMPFLWNNSDADYMNRDKRNQGYATMLEVYQMSRPTATVKDLKKRIDNMKTNYKLESAKMKKSMGTGSGADQVYTPKLWYFDLLYFLDEKQCTRSGRGTGEDDESQDNEESEPLEMEYVSSNPQNFPNTTVPPPQRKSKMSLEMKQNRLLDTAAELLAKKDDEWEVIGRSYSIQLKQLINEQRMIAQKLMSDCIYYGGTNQLNRTSYIELNATPADRLPLHYQSKGVTSHRSTPSPAQYSQHLRYVPYMASPTCSAASTPQLSPRECQSPPVRLSQVQIVARDRPVNSASSATSPEDEFSDVLI